jgi:hypothetical protein
MTRESFDFDPALCYPTTNPTLGMPLNTNNNNLGIRVFLLTLLMFPFAGAFGDWSVPEGVVAFATQDGRPMRCAP